MKKDFKDFLDFMASEKITEEWGKEADTVWNCTVNAKNDIGSSDAINYSEMYANNWTLFVLEKYHEWLNA